MDEDIVKPNPSNVREQEAFKRELYRRSMDRIRVYNPTDKDFVLLWGTEKYKYIIPSKNKDMGWGKGMRVFERYLAEKYARDMKNQLIHKMADDTLKSMEERMEKAGVDASLWKANETFNQSGKFKTDNPQLIKQIYQEIWLGVEEEFGVDMEETTDDGTQSADPTKTIEESILSGMDKKYVKPDDLKTEEVITEGNTRQEMPKKTITTFPINRKKKLVEEVSQ